MTAPDRAQEASSSKPRCNYDAFLSFRGEDTRKNFTSHLYRALVQAGIHTFLDDDGIKRGENIEAELQRAIKESKISIIVFSKDYVSSRWCLDELVMILKQRKDVGDVGFVVLPVFYDVDPSQVRKQTGRYATAFTKHERHFKKEMHRVKEWRTALKEVADLAGMALNNRHEAQFIQDIVKEIRKKLYRPLLNVAPHLVGIESRVKDINRWLQHGSSNVSIAIVSGIGGIGKTTIATTVYYQSFDRFQGCSFLANVRSTLKEPNGLVRLQSQLLSDLEKEKMNEVCSVDEGIMKIENAIYCKKVLIVIDDVDELDHLNAIIRSREWLYPGRKIIITTRHAHLLKADCVKFEVKRLDNKESLKLFNQHAFGQGQPTEDYMECSRKAVDWCGGLPLALKVLGSSLLGESIDVWKSALQKLEEHPCREIQEVLKISFDYQDDHDKNLFLDIACFFVGEKKDYAVAILDGCGFYTAVGIQNLINRCLLTVDDTNKLRMHFLLKDMARKIICQESLNDLGKRSRLWRHKDVSIVLKGETGTRTVMGLTFDKSTIGNCSKQFRLGSFSLSDEVDFETKTFLNMCNLKLLQLNYVELRGEYNNFSKNLIWLCWHGFPLESIPNNFSLEKLVVLDMRYSSLKHVWMETRSFTDLKFLDLCHSHCLVRTPDFSGVLSLQSLMLKECINLIEVDESIGNLDELVLLDLKDCKNLRKLPSNIGMLKSLKELILSGCSELDELHKEQGKIVSSRVLLAEGIDRNQLHASTSSIEELGLLSLIKTTRSTSFSLASLPHSLVKLRLENCNLSEKANFSGLASFPSLRFLDLSGNPFHSLPGSIKGLTSLEWLELRHCTRLQSLPESIKGLTSLDYLELTHCTRLQSLPEFPSSLAQFHADDCTSFERVPYLPLLPIHSIFSFCNCENLVEVEGIFKLEPIRNSDKAVLKSLGLSNFEYLESIEVDLDSYVINNERKLPLQVLHECGISSIFLPGSEVPDCFSFRYTGSFFSLHVPSLVGHKIRGLNLCTLYASDPESDSKCDRYNEYYTRIHNKTKHIRWTYEPIFFARQGADEGDMLWLSHWNFEYDEIEGDDEIYVSVGFPPPLEVERCGIYFVYEPDDRGTQSNTEETVLRAFPWYNSFTLTQAGADAIFCCHHSVQSVCGYRNSIDVLDDDYSKIMDDYEEALKIGTETCIICETFYEDMYEDNFYEEDD